ncbi:MAG: hypothetical protein ACLFR1_02830 [Spirochaetia bacterium]
MMKHSRIVITLIIGGIFFFTGCQILFYDPFDIKSSILQWETYRSDHFEYHYLSDTTDDDWSMGLRRFDGTTFTPNTENISEAVKEFSNHFEGWYSALAGLFGTDPAADFRMAVFNYASKQQQIEYSGGSADMFIDFSTIDGDGIAIHLGHEGVCGHEMVHIFQSSIGNAPGLLMEGMAVALGGAHWESEPDVYVDLPTLPLPEYSGPVETAAWNNYPLHALAGHIAGFREVEPWSDGEADNGEKPFGGTDLRPRDLMFWGSNFSNMWYTYCLGGSFVHYLVSAYGWKPFMEVYRNSVSSALTGTDVYALFEDAYGKPFHDLEAEWEQMLTKSGTNSSTDVDLSNYWSFSQ